MWQVWMTWSGVLGALGVALGAFGAHALKPVLPLQMMSIFETAVRYHLFHALALLGVALLLERLPRPPAALRWTARLLVAGVVLFSGSLYLYTVTDLRPLVWFTPVGGAAWVLAWALLAYAMWPRRRAGPGR